MNFCDHESRQVLFFPLSETQQSRKYSFGLAVAQQERHTALIVTTALVRSHLSPLKCMQMHALSIRCNNHNCIFTCPLHRQARQETEKAVCLGKGYLPNDILVPCSLSSRCKRHNPSMSVCMRHCRALWRNPEA